MRAWYGRHHYWFVVAASHGPAAAWGWHGFDGTWKQLGREFVDWTADDFAQPIDIGKVPVDLLRSLAQEIEAQATTSERRGSMLQSMARPG